MLLSLVFVVIFAFFMAAVLLGSRTRDDEKQILARFAGLRSAGPAGLSSLASTDFLKQTGPVASGWINLLLARIAGAVKLDELFEQAGTRSTARQLLVTTFAAALGVALLVFLFFHGLVIAALCGVVAGYLPMFLLKMRRKRRIAAFDKALPEVIEMMSRSLRAGHSLIAAISIVAEQAPEPARAEFGEVFRKQNFGLPLRDALMQLLARVPSQDLRVLVTGMLVQKDTGGNLVQILDRTSAVIRERLKLQGDIRVHTAQGRMTGWILCLLPVIMLVLINLINPGYSKSLTDDPLGRKFLYTGVVLLATGAFLIKRIVSSIEV